MKKEAWCESQTKCQEDLGDPDSWTCTAQLADGVVMWCPFSDPESAERNCVDYRLNKQERQ